MVEPSVAAAARSATAAAGIGREFRFRPRFQHAEATEDDAADRFAVFRMFRERSVLHALLDFEIARLLAGLRRNGFVNVGGHGDSFSVEAVGLKELLQLLRPDRFLRSE